MTFLQPLLLALGVLIGVPFIIHLLGERKYRPLQFPSLKFLREIEHDSLQKLHLRQWLVLMFRALWIAMLVLALALPFLSTTRGNTEPGIMIIDKSYSTQTDQNYSLAEKALRTEYNRWTFLEYFDKSHLDSLRSDIQRLMNGAKLKNPNIIILSDLQDNPQNKAIINMAGSLSERVFIVPIDKQNENYALNELRTINVQNGEMKGIEILLSQNESARSGQSVYINLDGKIIGQANTDIEGYANYYFSKPENDHVPCVASCPNDDFPEDNKRYLVIRNLQKIKILCVNAISEGHYHLNALRAMEGLEIKEINPDQLPAVNFDDYDILWFSAPYFVNKNILRNLIAYSNQYPVIITADQNVNNNIWKDLIGTIRAKDTAEGYYKIKDPLSMDNDEELMIKRFYQTDKSFSKILWETENGDPIWGEVEKNIFLLLAPFQFEWNEMGLSPYFTRVLNRALSTLVGKEERSYTINETIQLSGSFSVVTTPTGERHRVTEKFTHTGIPGFYTIENENELKLIAVNIPSEECVQAMIKPETINVIKWDRKNISTINDQIKGRNAQTIFYILALLFIILEMLLLGKGERTK